MRQQRQPGFKEEIILSEQDMDTRAITIESFPITGDADHEVEPADENETDPGMEFEADTETVAEMEAAE